MRDSKRDTDVKNRLLDSGRRRGWYDLREWHWNTYIIICEMNCQSRFDAWDRVLRAGALGWPRGMGWGGRWEGVFRMGNTCKLMADSCQCMAKPLQYCKVISLQLKKKIHLPIQETHVQSLGQEDPLEKGMATPSRILAGESHGQRSLPGHSHGVSKTWTWLSN